MFPGLTARQFLRDLWGELRDDNVSNGAAALAYYLMLAIFPATIFLLTLLPYLPVPNLDQAIMELIQQALPGDAAKLFTGTVQEITTHKRGGLLSFGLLATVWAASNGVYAIMQQLNITYDVKESRPFWKARGTAVLLMVCLAVMVVGAMALIVFGGHLQDWMEVHLGWTHGLLAAFAAFRWAVIALLLLLGMAVIYYVAPDVQQRFRFVSPGSVLAMVALVVASLAFRFYVARFGNYSATYGTLGAVVVLLLWLYVVGWVMLLGSEVNALVEHYSPAGKLKGEKQEPAAERPLLPLRPLSPGSGRA